MSLIGLIVGGFIGTAVMTAFMMMGKSMGMMPPDWNMIADGLGNKMEEMMGVPANMAMGVHFLIGGIILPLLFGLIWAPLILDGYLGGIIFFLIFGIIMILMLDFLGAPSEFKMKMSVGIIIGHIIYAVIVVLFGTLF